jgi:hypothetical protein
MKHFPGGVSLMAPYKQGDVAPQMVCSCVTAGGRAQCLSLVSHWWHKEAQAVGKLYRMLRIVEIHQSGRCLSWSLNIRIDLALWVIFLRIPQTLTCLEISGYQIKYNTVIWFLELQIKRGRKLWTWVHNIYSNSRNSSCQCSLYSKKSSILRMFYLYG